MSTERKWLLLRILSWVLPVILVLGVSILIWDAQQTSTSYDSLVVSDLKLTDTELSLKLDCTDSGRFFKWRRFDTVRGVLYLEVGSGPLAFTGHHWPVYNHIRNPHLEKVSSIYLRDGTSARLIYID